jgi:hypothetical protein
MTNLTADLISTIEQEQASIDAKHEALIPQIRAVFVEYAKLYNKYKTEEIDIAAYNTFYIMETYVRGGITKEWTIHVSGTYGTNLPHITLDILYLTDTENALFLLEETLKAALEEKLNSI